MKHEQLSFINIAGMVLLIYWVGTLKQLVSENNNLVTLMDLQSRSEISELKVQIEN